METIVRETAFRLVNMMIERGILEVLNVGRAFNDWFYDSDLPEEGFQYFSGLTKVCVIHEELEGLGYVLKFGYGRGEKDYASIEYDIYCLAKQEGFAEYFPETFFLGDFENVSFYVQELTDCNEEAITSEWFESIRNEQHEECDEEDAWDAVDNLSDEEAIMITFHDYDFYEFLLRNHVNDFHEGNFGYIGDRIVIVDFSGYNRV